MLTNVDASNSLIVLVIHHGRSTVLCRATMVLVLQVLETRHLLALNVEQHGEIHIDWMSYVIEADEGKVT
eukprot:12697237-Ditylum_brightwellii.AAC.1